MFGFLRDPVELFLSLEIVAEFLTRELWNLLFEGNKFRIP